MTVSQPSEPLQDAKIEPDPELKKQLVGTVNQEYRRREGVLAEVDLRNIEKGLEQYPIVVYTGGFSLILIAYCKDQYRRSYRN